MSCTEFRFVLASPFLGARDSAIRARLEAIFSFGGSEVQWVEFDSRLTDVENSEVYLSQLPQPGECERLVMGGYSLGARIAVQLAPTMQPCALICVGFPFHHRGVPNKLLGKPSLEHVAVPLLILQGERDCYGNSSQVKSYGLLPGRTTIHWLRDQNHRLQPRKPSVCSREDEKNQTSEQLLQFLASV